MSWGVVASRAGVGARRPTTSERSNTPPGDGTGVAARSSAVYPRSRVAPPTNCPPPHERPAKHRPLTFFPSSFFPPFLRRRGRTGVQLKDKWRNLIKFQHLRRGEAESAPHRTGGRGPGPGAKRKKADDG